jgi:hypothetical protein
MRSSISEFSYGYALTEKMVRRTAPLVTVAPRFPSLREEGKQGNGYDLEINCGIPIFIQFKLSDVFRRASIRELKCALNPPLKLPLYRMHLRSRRYSNQHESLLSLELKGNAVYYAAPMFSSGDELNQYYSSDKIIEKSVFISPSQIGEISDDKDHHVSFSPSTDHAYRFSQPQLISSSISHHRFFEQIERKIGTSDMRFTSNNWGDRYFDRLTSQILEAIAEQSPLNFNRDQLMDVPSLERLTYVAQVLLGSQLLFVGYGNT